MLNAFDFFCGAGGLTRGLQQAGINVVAGIDLNPECAETYAANSGPAVFWNADIKQFSHDSLLHRFPNVVQDPDNLLLAGCPPCQSFSRQRRSHIRRSDSTLLSDFGFLVDAVKPRAVLIENVPGITKIKGRSAYARFVTMLRNNGYNIASGVVNAAAYGVPQNRKRFILLAVRHAVVTLPKATHGNGKGLLPYVTLRQTIANYPALTAGEASFELNNHCVPALSELNIKRLMHTPKDGGSRRNWPEDLVLHCHKARDVGHADVYGRMYWDRPAPTLTGRCCSISNGRYAHPEQNRAISLREAAAIQTFPDDYMFYGTVISIERQIGNAVPVLLGKALGAHIIKLLQSKSHEDECITSESDQNNCCVEKCQY